jgi:hypothetical protein
VVSEFSERLALTKQESQKFDVERFNLGNLNELEVRKQYQIKISNRFVALEEGHKKGLGGHIKTSAKQSLGLYKL